MKDDIDQIHDKGLSLTTRTIFFCDEINEESADKFIKNLHILDNHKSGTVTVRFSTDGGCVISGFRMFNAIRGMKNHVRGIIEGECSSMGTVVAQSFDERLMLPDSFMMIHQGSQTISGHPKSNENWLKFYKHLDSRCYKIYLEKINNKQREKKKKQLKLQELDKMLDFDTILLAEKVVQLGLADAILEGSY